MQISPNELGSQLPPEMGYLIYGGGVSVYSVTDWKCQSDTMAEERDCTCHWWVCEHGISTWKTVLAWIFLTSNYWATTCSSQLTSKCKWKQPKRPSSEVQMDGICPICTIRLQWTMLRNWVGWREASVGNVPVSEAWGSSAFTYRTRNQAQQPMLVIPELGRLRDREIPEFTGH